MLDTDRDGVPDISDLFPTDPTEWADLDGDGVGDNSDPDRDGDGISNDYEQQLGTDPNDAGSVPPDLDGDAIPDALDDDRDGDGVGNEQDTYPDDNQRHQLASVSGFNATLVDTQVSLSWGANADSANLGGYLLYRNAPGASPNLLTQLSADTTAYTDATAINGSGYEYQVRAIDSRNNEGEAGQAAQVFVAYNTTAVTGLSVTRAQASARVSWNSAGSFDCQLLRAENGVSATLLATVNITSHFDDSTLWHKPYSYQVATVATFNNPFTGSTVTLVGPLSSAVAIAPVPQVSLNLTSATRIDGSTFEQERSGDSLTLSGKVTDLLSPATVKAQSGSESRSAQTSNGEFRLVLPAGASNAWQITATESNYADRTATATLNLVSDDAAPTVTIDGAATRVVNAEQATITGTALDARGVIASVSATNHRYTGQSFGVTLNAAGKFSAEVPLAIGDNAITVRASDPTGNAGQAQVTLTRPAPLYPTLRIDSPGNGSTVAADRINVSGVVYSGLSPEQIRLRLGSAEQTLAAGPSPYVFPFTFANVLLQQGSNTLTVIASTPAGDAEARFTVTYQSDVPKQVKAPTLTLPPSLLTGTVNSAIVVIRGSVDAPGRLSTLTINGEAVNTLAAGGTIYSFNHGFNFGAVPGEEASLPIAATDALGQTTVEVFTLRRDTQAPQITVTTPGLQPPPAVNSINALPLVLTGEITEPNLAGVSVNGESIGVKPLAEGVYGFEVRVNMAPAVEQTLVVEAWGSANNRATEYVSVIANVPTTVEFIAPAPNDAVQVSAHSSSVEFIARVSGLEPEHQVALSVDGTPMTDIQTDLPVFKATATLPLDKDSATLSVTVIDAQGQKVVTANNTITLVNTDNLPLSLDRVQPENGTSNVRVDEFIGLYFNRAVDPNQLTVTVRETVHGKTWDLSGLRGSDAITAGEGSKLIEVHRDLERVPGSLSRFPGDTVMSYHLTREFAYGAQVYVDVNYAGAEIGASQLS